MTIRLPESLYHQAKQRARRMQRSVEEEVAAVVEAALPALDELPSTVTAELEQMAFLTDDELKQAARVTVTRAENQRIQPLLRQQRSGLSQEEAAEAERLAQRQERVVLVRAQAAVLLRARGYDVSDLIDPS